MLLCFSYDTKLTAALPKYLQKGRFFFLQLLKRVNSYFKKKREIHGKTFKGTILLPQFFQFVKVSW